MGHRLVGREHELELLDELLDDCRRGSGRAVLIGGEAGIGKSALVAAFAERAAAEHVVAAVGRSSSAVAPPFWPWRQVLEALDPGVDLPWATRAAGGRESVFADVVDRVAAAAADAPCLIVVEDLQWADGSSLALLRFVVDAVPGLGALLAMTVREPLEPGAAADTVEALPAAVDRLPLAGLDVDATASIARRVLGPTLDDDAVSAIHDRTGGNPFFVVEVARLRALQGRRASGVVPPGVRQVLGRRLARLSQRTAATLTWAAVSERFDVALLSRLTGQEAAEVEAHLDEAVRAQLARSGPAGLEFSHALVREVLADDLGGRLAGAHRRIALALEEGDEPPPPAALAVHWSRADGPDAAERAAAHALPAARQAASEMAFEQAVPLFTLALAGPAVDALAVGLEAGEARILAGDLPEGREQLRSIARRALDDDRPDLAARAVLAMGGGLGGFEVDQSDEEQVSLTRRVLAALTGESDDLRAALLARLSLVAAWTMPVETRIELTTEALELCAGTAHGAVRVSVLSAHCDSIAGPDFIDQRLEAASEMLPRAEATGDLRLVALARRLRVVAHLERGDLAAADREIGAYERTAHRLGAPLYQWPVPMWRGMRALLDGDIDAAFDWVARAEALQHRARSSNADAMVFTLRHAALVAAGRHDETVPALEQQLVAYSGYRGAECFIAGAFAVAGRLDRASALLERQLAAGFDTLDKDSEFVEFVWMAGTAAVALEHREAMGAAYRALEPYASVWAVDGIGAAVFGIVAHQLGVLSRHLDDPATAREWLSTALRAHRAAGAPALVAATEAELSALEAEPTPRAADADPERATFRRDGAVWRAEWRGVIATIKDSKGMSDIAVLLGRPGTEVDVLDLAGTGREAAGQGDAGPAIDAAAKRAYRQRLDELDEDIAEADANADIGRLSALREERQFLLDELAAGLGLGGRPRRVGDQRERARKAVGMRIGTALNAIDAAHPALGRHLRNSLATGRFCSYTPERPTSWDT